MTLTINLVTIVALASVATSVPVTTVAAQQDIQPPLPHQLDESFSFQLPRVESNPIPFNAPEPQTYLVAPKENQEPDYYQVPIPDQELVAPSEEAWNPDDNPQFYYEVPAVLTKQEVPTRQFPKKFNKDVHLKVKPYASKPKQELLLQPIEESVYVQRQRDLQKVVEHLNKKENQKLIQVLPSKPIPEDPVAAPSDLEEQREGSSFEQGLSEQLTSSLGIPAASHGSPAGERLQFHMAGHDGPLSYKWGYDTGKGHNRQFRFEEKDKEGVVKGHYGYYDKQGKLRVIHYDAHPLDGFHSESNDS